jgi:predicted ATPase
MNGEEHPDIPSASIYDKMDWRKVIQARLEDCLKAIGTIDFPRKVESLIACFAATYPGFNARDQVDKFIILLDKEYELRKKLWLTANQTNFWWEKKIRFAEFRIAHDREIYNFIRDLSGIKRMLLWGGLDSEARDYVKPQD